MKRLVITAIILISLGAITGGGAIYLINHWAFSAVILNDPKEIDVTPGVSLRTLASDLEKADLISSPIWFEAWVRMERLFPKFKAGHYRFVGEVTPVRIVLDIVNGNTYNPIVLQYTIPEGFTLPKIAARLSAHRLGTEVTILKLFKDPKFIAEQGLSSPTLEGYIYPATYSFTKIPTLQEAVHEMVKTFWEKIPTGYQDKIKSRGLTLHQAVTFGSLIELETLHDEEKPLVSEVIWRRLKDNSPLGIDAALIYGIPDYAGDIKSKHLIDASNPYNTRIHRGLPPTPIGSVSKSSLEAVLTPSNMGYYFYVLMPGADSRHHFSKSLDEHNHYVRDLVKATRGPGSSGTQNSQGQEN